MAPALNEHTRRLWAAVEARTLGYGGIALVERATGVSRSTIARGIREAESGACLVPDRIRKIGAGRKRTVATDPTLMADMDGLVEPTASGDPRSPLRWTSKSVRKLAGELRDMGHSVSHRMVAELLHEAGYSLQANHKTRAGGRPAMAA